MVILFHPVREISWVHALDVHAERRRMLPFRYPRFKLSPKNTVSSRCDNSVQWHSQICGIHRRIFALQQWTRYLTSFQILGWHSFVNALEFVKQRDFNTILPLRRYFVCPLHFSHSFYRRSTLQYEYWPGKGQPDIRFSTTAQRQKIHSSTPNHVSHDMYFCTSSSVRPISRIFLSKQGRY